MRLLFIEFRRVLSRDFGPLGSEGLDHLVSVFLCDDLLALLTDLLGHLSPALQQPVEGLLNGPA